MSIRQKITSWDGRSRDGIAAIYDTHRTRPDFAEQLVQLLPDRAYQQGATWLLKAYVESGHQLARTQTKTIYASLPVLEHWEAKLHVLQCLRYVPVNEPEKNQVEAFLRASLTDPNKLVRAWAYNGFYELSRQYPEYRQETGQLFEMALRDEAASVKARIRNIMKMGM